MNEVDIPVGNGPVTITSVWTSIASGLVALASFLTTMTGSLPEGVDPALGLYLTFGAGLVATLAQVVAGLSRARFAEAKARIMTGQSAYDPFIESLGPEDVAVEPPTEADPDPEVPTDTNVEPPVEP